MRGKDLHVAHERDAWTRLSFLGGSELAFLDINSFTASGYKSIRVLQGEPIASIGGRGDGTLHHFHSEQYPSCPATQADGSVLVVEAWFRYSVSYSCWHPLLGGIEPGES